VDEPQSSGSADAGQAERRTRGGSWWYGSAQMQADHLQGKPADTAVVYIGFRCAKAPH
jgi:formylglycine-generating enzyme required for sulfatase activity